MSLLDISQAVIANAYQFLSAIIYNVVMSIVEPIVDMVYNVFVPLGDSFDLVNQMFGYIRSFCVYVLDLSMLYPEIRKLILMILAYRITLKFQVYIIKLVLSWWHQLAP